MKSRMHECASTRGPGRHLPSLRLRTPSQAVRCFEDLLAGRAHADVVSQVHPAHPAGVVNQELGGPRNVRPFVAAYVHEIVGADGLHPGVSKEWEGYARFRSKRMGDLDGVNADRHHLNAALAELAQLTFEAP